MQRWISSQYAHGENPAIDAFIEDIKEVYRKHGMAISHEDFHGRFEIVKLDQEHVEWLEGAADEITPP